MGNHDCLRGDSGASGSGNVGHYRIFLGVNHLRWVVIPGDPLLVVTDRDLIRTVIFFETQLFVESNIVTQFIISITLMDVCIVFVSITMCMYRIFVYLTI